MVQGNISVSQLCRRQLIRLSRPGKVVGVVGIGGLGYAAAFDVPLSNWHDVRHFALQFARALGADKVIAFSHSSTKKVLSDLWYLCSSLIFLRLMPWNWVRLTLFLQATITSSVRGKARLTLLLYVDFPRKSYLLMFIQNTTDVSSAIPLSALMKTLNVHGRCILVSIPDEELPTLKAGGANIA